MNDRAVIVIIRNSQLLLMHRRKHGKNYYILPGGTMEPGETQEDTCIREAKEETGLSVTIKKKICTLNNQGRTDDYFLAASYHGEIKLGGPERERYSSDNRYDLEWVGLERLRNINLKPSAIRQTCIDCLRQFNK